MSPSVSRLVQLERALVSAERKLALLDSLMPRNFSAEVARLTAAFERGRVELPEFHFSGSLERHDRSRSVAATLAAAQIALSDGPFRNELLPGLAELLLERIQELLLEVQMLRECGQPALRTLAAARYRFFDEELEASQELARAWSAAPLSPKSGDGDILLALAFEQRRRQLGQLGEGILIAEREIASLCAVGGSHLYVKRGARVDRLEADRLWVHEVEGHLLPRLAAQQESAPFSIGAPCSGIDEEGRAVWLEEKHGLLDGARKRELSLRFYLALALREGGEEGVRHHLRAACDAGASPVTLARAVCRIFRGGGLGREVIYLPGYLRVKATLEQSPAREEFFRRGLASVRTLDFFETYFSKEARNQ